MQTTTKKELILISPCVSHLLIRIAVFFMFTRHIPSALWSIAASTPKDYKIKIFNLKLFWFRWDFTKGALVGITCLTSSSRQAYELADRFRKAGSFVVMGGPHVTALPDEALKHCDSVVIGEAESVWKEVVCDYENKSLQKKYYGQPVDDFFTPFFNYVKDLNPRLLYYTLYFIRGCKYNCDFCARPAQALRHAKIEQVVELIKRMKGSFKNPFLKRPYFAFEVDNIYSDPSYAKELFRQLIPLKIRWASGSSMDIAFDEEALALARKSGCDSLLVGFETIHPHEYEKTSVYKIISTDDYKEAVKKIKSHGIKVNGSFILGLDSYSNKDYLKLLGFLFRVGFWHYAMTILTPFPGSKIYEQFKKENRILTFDWYKYDLLQHVVFKPKQISILSLYFWYSTIRSISILFTPVFWQLLFAATASLYGSYYLSYFLVKKLREILFL